MTSASATTASLAASAVRAIDAANSRRMYGTSKAPAAMPMAAPPRRVMGALIGSQNQDDRKT
jgi:hypothetical protein